MEVQAEIYVVATPIGNLQDISRRALDVLSRVDIILAEDTRHTKRMLDQFGISAKLVSLHEHNEKHKSDAVLTWVKEGKSVALVSDAGTPLISDPGYTLVKKARKSGLSVIPVPGASAFVAALSVSGIASDRFAFEGFLPAKKSACRDRLASLGSDSRTLIFYESPHRIVVTLELIAELYPKREMMLARELTKAFETKIWGCAGEILDRLRDDPNQQRGEMVLVLEGDREVDVKEVEEVRGLLAELLEVLPAKKACQIISRELGFPKNALYQLALEIKGK